MCTDSKSLSSTKKLEISHEIARGSVVGLGSGQLAQPRGGVGGECGFTDGPHGVLVAPHQVGTAGSRPFQQMKLCISKPWLLGCLTLSQKR